MSAKLDHDSDDEEQVFKQYKVSVKAVLDMLC